MDIHPPEHPILTWREFFVHIGTVTIGILIALSLEGLLESNHHRHTIREARENIRTEMEDNQREISGHLAEAERNRSDAQNVLRWIDEMEKSQRTSVQSLRVGFNRAELNSASWTTAQAVGALGLMDYAEVKRDAAVYQVQEEYERMEARAEDASIAAMELFAANPASPEKASGSELVEERSRIAKSLTALTAQEQIGRQLQQRYATRLKEQ